VAIYKDTDYVINNVSLPLLPSPVPFVCNEQVCLPKASPPHLSSPHCPHVCFLPPPCLLFISVVCILVLGPCFGILLSVTFKYFLKTSWLPVHLHQQKTGLSSRCENAECLSIRAEQKIVSGWSAWVSVLFAFLYYVLLYSVRPF
jgi:hypothetical protein